MLQCMCKTRGRPDWLKTLNQFRILAFERYKAILRKLYSYFRKKLRSRPIRFTKSDYLMVDVVINVYQSWCCSSQFRKTQSYEGGLWEFSADAAVLCSAWSYAGDVSRTRAARVQNVHDQTTMYQHAWGLQGETTSTLVEREGAALLQQSFGLHSTIRTQPWQVLSRPIGWDQSFWCFASTFNFGLGCGYCLLAIPPLKCAGFVNCHCTGRWVVLDNTQGEDSGTFHWGLLCSHNHGLYFY